MEVWWILGGIAAIALGSWLHFKVENDDSYDPYEKIVPQTLALFVMVLGAIVALGAGAVAMGWY